MKKNKVKIAFFFFTIMKYKWQVIHLGKGGNVRRMKRFVARVNAQYDDDLGKHLLRRCTAISQLIDKL